MTEELRCRPARVTTRKLIYRACGFAGWIGWFPRDLKLSKVNEKKQLLLFLVKRTQIYYKSSSEVQSTPNVIKITSRSTDHRTTIVAARTSRRRATDAASIPESAYPYRWQPESLHACALKDQPPRAAVVTIELLNRSEEPDTKSHCRVCMTRNPNLAGPRSWLDSMLELRLIRPNGQTWGGSKPG